MHIILCLLHFLYFLKKYVKVNNNQSVRDDDSSPHKCGDDDNDPEEFHILFGQCKRGHELY